MSSPPSVLVVGEPLAELRPRPDGALDLSYSGDALNVAVRLARGGARVSLATAVGADRFSGGLLRRLADEGVSDRWVHRSGGGVLGLYLVELDGAERRFTYWRATSEARHLVDALGPDRIAAAAGDHDAVVVSGITLAVLDPPQRGALLDALAAATRGGTRVVLDPNVRPALWESPDEARRWVAGLVSLGPTVLASVEDLDLLGADAAEWAAQVPELVVTAGDGPTRWWHGGRSGKVEVGRVTASDTTGAGDAFDAAYVLARGEGAPVPDAVARGHTAAADAVSHPGGLRWAGGPDPGGPGESGRG